MKYLFLFVISPFPFFISFSPSFLPFFNAPTHPFYIFIYLFVYCVLIRSFCVPQACLELVESLRMASTLPSAQSLKCCDDYKSYMSDFLDLASYGHRKRNYTENNGIVMNEKWWISEIQLKIQISKWRRSSQIIFWISLFVCKALLPQT